MDGSSSGSGSGSSSGFSGSSSGFSGSSTGSSSGVSGSSSGGSPNGSIYLEECSGAFCDGQSFSVYGSFFTAPQGNGGCTVTGSGACAYYSCTGSMQQNGVSAGTLVVSGPWLMPPVTLAPGANDFYEYTSSSPGFTAGQTITVTASGAVVPAFGPDGVVAPQLTQLTSPSISPDGGTTVIPTGVDLQLTWSGGQAGATMLFQAAGSNGQDYTYCTWNGTDGQGTVPAATLKPFSGTSGYLFYGQYNSTSFFAGPYAISLTALPYTGGAVSFQ